MSALYRLALFTSLASASLAVAQTGWIGVAYPALSNMRINPPVTVTAEVYRVKITMTNWPDIIGAPDCAYTSRINAAAMIGPDLPTNQYSNTVTLMIPQLVCVTSPCVLCDFGPYVTNYVTNASLETVGLQSRDVWQWDAHWAIAERADAIGADAPWSTLYRGNYEALTAAKQWVSNHHASFRLPTDTNIPPAPWTLTGLVAAVGAPATYFEATSQRAGATDWQYIRPLLTNLYVTWIIGGCATNCDPRTSDMGLHQQIVNGVCTNGAAWAFSSNDTCALPGAALVAQVPVYGTTYVWRSRQAGYVFGAAGDLISCDGVFTATMAWAWTTNTSCTSTGRPYSDYCDVITNVVEAGTFYGTLSRQNELISEYDSVCSGFESCLTRSSNPIGYVVPSTNRQAIRVEYLAAGLPSYADYSSLTCAPTQYQSEAISASLSNGAWVAVYSNTAMTRAWCNTNYVTTNQPYLATCATNAGWAVTNAGARLVWQFRYL